jgi:hypothetical protein
MISIRQLRELYGDDCWLCLRPIDFRRDGQRDRMRATRDHVIPLARGGPDSPENLRPAHKWCNERRGNREGMELVRFMAGLRSGEPPCQEERPRRRMRSSEWDDLMAARQPSGGRVLVLGDEPVLPCM